jgi:hypothetical protein
MDQLWNHQFGLFWPGPSEIIVAVRGDNMATKIPATKIPATKIPR